MRAVFLARGPAFDAGVVVEPFQNIHVYALLAHLLGLRPASNDGALDSVKALMATPAHAEADTVRLSPAEDAAVATNRYEWR